LSRREGGREEYGRQRQPMALMAVTFDVVLSWDGHVCGGGGDGKGR